MSITLPSNFKELLSIECPELTSLSKFYTLFLDVLVIGSYTNKLRFAVSRKDNLTQRLYPNKSHHCKSKYCVSKKLDR